MFKLLHRYQLTLLPALAVLICFAVLCFGFFPLYNSGDDFQFMYRLSGNAEGSPTEILHLDYCWHPLAGWILKMFFMWMPGPNWYAVFLVALLYVAHSVQARFLARMLGRWAGIICWFLLFLFSGAQTILSLNYTSAAWNMAIGGYLLILESGGSGNKKPYLFTAWPLLILAGLMRIHALAAVTVFFLLIFMKDQPRRWRYWGSQVALLAIAMVGFAAMQKAYYRAHIPDWDQRQAIRMALVKLYNHPIDRSKPWDRIYKDSAEALSFLNHFYYKSPFVQEARIDTITDRLVRVRGLHRAEDRQMFYWFFMGSRVHLLLLLVIFLVCWSAGLLKKVIYRCFLPLALVAGFFGYLLFFLKLTVAVYYGLISLGFLGLFIAFDRTMVRQLLPGRSALLLWLLLLPAGWMGLRLYRQQLSNLQNYAAFIRVTDQIRQHPGFLFVAIDNSLSMDSYYIWDRPSDFIFKNLVHKGRGQLVQDSILYGQTRISNRDEKLFLLPQVRLIGENTNELAAFFRVCYGRNISFERAAEQYDGIKVWKAKTDSLK